MFPEAAHPDILTSRRLDSDIHFSWLHPVPATCVGKGLQLIHGFVSSFLNRESNELTFRKSLVDVSTQYM